MQKVVRGWGRERHAVRCRGSAPPAQLRSGHRTLAARSVPIADHRWPRIAMREEIISSMKTALFTRLNSTRQQDFKRITLVIIFQEQQLLTSELLKRAVEISQFIIFYGLHAHADILFQFHISRESLTIPTTQKWEPIWVIRERIEIEPVFYKKVGENFLCTSKSGLCGRIRLISHK